jgi:hypothetical protein
VEKIKLSKAENKSLELSPLPTIRPLLIDRCNLINTIPSPPADKSNSSALEGVVDTVVDILYMN